MEGVFNKIKNLIERIDKNAFVANVTKMKWVRFNNSVSINGKGVVKSIFIDVWEYKTADLEIIVDGIKTDIFKAGYSGMYSSTYNGNYAFKLDINIPFKTSFILQTTYQSFVGNIVYILE